MNNIQNHSDKGIIKYLIGNKVDTDKREVTAEEAQKVAEQYGMSYYETSAKLNKNITEVIKKLVTEVYNKSAGSAVATGGFGLSAAGASLTSFNPAKCCGQQLMDSYGTDNYP
eukprot:TRINITY_DN130263_c0_g1_i1.p2 TRINITY_DN130263_c0_g1~~TRINITY_DN130263_c0_g1_i1.p2  ORF type:complete len:113 (+),score=17.15 TRINITY_DN130263_c0_g1_i1:2-340(+)